MKFTVRQCCLIAGLALSVTASSTLAQVAPPPTQPTKEEPKYEPAQKPVAPKQAPKQAAQPNSRANQPASASGTSLPTDTPYPRLAVKGEDGKIKRLTELPDILALRSNPTVGPKSVEAIMPILFGRRARFERILIENLDLYWMVTDGRLDELDLNNMQALAQITEMIKPLVGLTSLSKELLNRGILTRTQGGMNQHIVSEYKQAVTAEIQFESEEPMGEIMRFILNDSIHETNQAYKAMIAEASENIGTIIKELGLTSPNAVALAGLQRPLNKDRDAQRAELAEFDAAFRLLSYEEGIQILTAMRNQRKNPDFSPMVRKINVLHSRKLGISNNETMQGKIKFADGREVTTKELREANNEKLRKQREEIEKNTTKTSDDD